MTEYIKAKEYLKAQCEKRKDSLVLEMPQNYITDVEQAFIDGYHECQKEHEWHDLEKDPTDEPKKDGEYLVQVMCIMFNDVEYCVGRYWKEENRWEGEQVRGLLVTKWKEIE